MIVFEHGKFYQNPPSEFWWIGKRMHCEKCGCGFELQYENKPVYLGHLDTPSPQFSVSCPECGSVETIEQKETKPAEEKPDDTHLPW